MNSIQFDIRCIRHFMLVKKKNIILIYAGLVDDGNISGVIWDIENILFMANILSFMNGRRFKRQ